MFDMHGAEKPMGVDSVLKAHDLPVTGFNDSVLSTNVLLH